MSKFVRYVWICSLVCTGCISQCDFDEGDELCGWTTNTLDPALPGWTFWNGPTETPGTGPDDDFSKPGCKEKENMNFNTFIVF